VSTRAGWVRSAALGVGAAIAAGVVLEVLYVAGHPGAIPVHRVISFFYLLPSAAAFAVVGAAVIARLPKHPIGWLFGVVAVDGAVGVLANGYTAWALPGGDAVTWVSAVSRGAAFGALGLALVLYPTGRPSSPRWRWLVRLLVGYMAGSMCLAAFARWQIRPYPNETFRADNPVGVFGPAAGIDVLGIIDTVGSIIVLIALVSLAVRWRAATGDEREQVKWMALAALVFVVVASIGVGVLLLRDAPPGNPAGGFLVGDAIFQIALSMIPVAMGIGISRYRLYDIDHLISRAVTYGTSAALIAGAYTVAVVVIGEVIAGGAGASTVVALAATAMVAVAFHPAQSWLQRRADRWVFGDRAVPYELMTGFARHLGQASAPADVLGRIAEAAGHAVRADTSRVTVSLPGDGVLERRWGDLHHRELYDIVVPVDDESGPIGEVAVAGGTRRAGDVELLDHIVGVAGAAMRNLRLLAELELLYELVEEQNREIAASRSLLVAAAEDEQRRLRETISLRIEPQLDTLRRSLARMQVAELSAREATVELRSLVAVATAVVEEIRAVSRGVLPPVLADHGLPAALRAALRSVDIDVRLDVGAAATGLRFEMPIEATVFLCCAAVIHDAEETSATTLAIRIECGDRQIHFTAAHDGPGARGVAAAELLAARERLAALGGELDLDALDGLRLVGYVPFAAPDEACSLRNVSTA